MLNQTIHFDFFRGSSMKCPLIPQGGFPQGIPRGSGPRAFQLCDPQLCITSRPTFQAFLVAKLSHSTGNHVGEITSAFLEYHIIINYTILIHINPYYTCFLDPVGL